MSSLPAQQEYSIRQNQLVLLSLLADALVDLLCEDDIEVLRSSTSDLLTSLETTPTPHPKQELAECCIPLIKNSQQIIDKVTGAQRLVVKIYSSKTMDCYSMNYNLYS